MCVNPYIAVKKDGTPIPVPCGKCLDCRKQWQNEWIFRLTQECKRSVCPCFVTLTYNDKHLPLEPHPETGELQSVVVKKDVQNFMKRLRKYGGKLLNGCRYFAVGEYGSNFNRCHYHLILIAPAISQASELSDLVNRAWNSDGEQIGFTLTKYATDKQIHYVCKYMNKIDDREHLVKPFRLFSRSIGLNFLTDRMINYYLSTFDRTCINGKMRIGLPRYYKKKLDELSSSKYGLKKAGLVYSDLLDDIRPVPGTKYFYLKDFTQNYGKYFSLAVADMAQHFVEYEKLSDSQVRQWCWSTYVKTHKAVKDMILEDSRLLSECKIRNKLIGMRPVDYHLPASVILQE